MDLHSLKPNKGATRATKRLGRGVGSGTGKTAGKGHKGMKARAGHANKVGFEGGQTPMYRRLPKQGFLNPNRLNVKALNVSALDALFKDGETVSPETLSKKGLYPAKFDRLKILGNGDTMTKKLIVKAHSFSKSAIEKLANSQIETIQVREPYRRVKK